MTAARCADGRRFEGGLFVSDVHPQLTVGWLAPSGCLKRTFTRRIAALENTFGMFTASLVLRPGELRYFNHNKYVYRRADVWSLAEGAGTDVDGVMVSCRVPASGEWTRQVDLLTPMPAGG